MNSHTSLFSLSKISISYLLSLKEKNHKNQIVNTKSITESSNSEDIFTKCFKKNFERGKICLSKNTCGDTLNSFSFFYNRPVNSKVNKKSFDTAGTPNENINLEQIDNTIILEQRCKIGNALNQGNDKHLIQKMSIEKDRSLTRRKSTDTKVIWDSIQENIKSIVSSCE